MSTLPGNGSQRLTLALRRPDRGRIALCAFITAGYPTTEAFDELLPRIARVADAVEIGVPFSDPMADGLTIQRASRRALENGVTLRSILEGLRRHRCHEETPLVLMSYLNPLLSFGYEELASAAVASGVTGFVVPDLPLEESGPLREALDAHGLALVQLVTPASPQDRMLRLCNESRGFVYAVTVTGTTGAAGIPGDVVRYLERVRESSKLPVLAGFGIREAAQVEAIAETVDGVVVGTALIEAVEQGIDPVEFLESLRGTPPALSGEEP